MKNFFIIHGSFGNSKEHYLPWLEKELKHKGEVVCVDFPIGVDNQNYSNWANVLNKYKQKINKNSIFIGRSIGPIFIIKYLMRNNLKIQKLISISGFNNFLVGDANYDEVNASMFVNNLKEFKKNCNNVVCIYSENDPYVKLNALKSFADDIATTQVDIKDGGHFNTESGYGEKFEELLKYV